MSEGLSVKCVYVCVRDDEWERDRVRNFFKQKKNRSSWGREVDICWEIVEENLCLALSLSLYQLEKSLCLCLSHAKALRPTAAMLPLSAGSLPRSLFAARSLQIAYGNSHREAAHRCASDCSLVRLPALAHTHTIGISTRQTVYAAAVKGKGAAFYPFEHAILERILRRLAVYFSPSISRKLLPAF